MKSEQVDDKSNSTAELLGEVVDNWTSRPHPLSNPDYHQLQGQYCRLELLNSGTDAVVLQQLFDVFQPTEETHFKYLKYGPFETVDQFKELVRVKELPSSDTVLYTIFVDDRAVGFIGYLRINPDQGTIEIGNVNFSEQLVRTRQATESVYLLLELAFDRMGYRRVEWRTNALNIKSRQAAIRYGFQYEGTWKKSEIAKGRSRDNAWFSMTDDEWLFIKKEFNLWLNPINFDALGQQMSKLNGSQVNPRQVKVIDVLRNEN